MSAVIFASDHSQFDPGEVLGPPALNQNYVVLLQVVSLPRDERHHFLAVGQPHLSTSPVGRVGLPGFLNQRLEDDALDLRAAKHGTHGWWPRFGLPLAVHLVECSHGPGEEGA